MAFALPSPGIVTLRDLADAGILYAAVRAAIRRGDLWRVRDGVVATPSCDAAVIAAARVGGRLAGVSAARFLGVWAPERSALVVEVPRGVHVPPTAARVIRGPAGRRRYGCSAPAEIVAQVLRTESVPVAVAVLDSLTRRTGLSRLDLDLAAAGLPRRLRAILEFVDARAESGTESLVRVLLALVGIVATPQVRVPFSDLGRLDLVVGDRLVLECDSRAHHSTPEELDRDNARDLALTALGFIVLRIRYRRLVDDPDSVVAAVQRLVDAGLHLDGTAPSRRDTP